MADYFDYKLSEFLAGQQEEKDELGDEQVQLSEEQDEAARDVLTTLRSKSIICRAGSGRKLLAIR
jgi:hypothetical protein